MRKTLMISPSGAKLTPNGPQAARQSVTVRASKLGSPDPHNKSISNLKKDTPNGDPYH